MKIAKDENQASKYIYRRHPKKSLTVIVLVLVFLLLIGVEAVLRMIGHQPGNISTGLDFYQVDSLVVYDDYVSDEDGIYRVSEKKRKLVEKIIANGQLDKSENNENTPDVEKTILQVIEDFDQINKGRLDDVEFYYFVNQLKKTPTTARTESDIAYQTYLKSPINQDGFRSIPFQRYNGEKTTVLLLGDSFTWGLTANPIVNSFADRLSARGYHCYNSGIIGADPAQYLAVAQKFIPLLQPDIVIVNFFMGNDQMDYKRIIEPHKSIWYPTNAGWLMANPYGCWLAPQEAYDYFNYWNSIPIENNSSINVWYAKTVLSTRLWELLRKYDLVSATYIRPCESTKEGLPVSEYYLYEIEKVCQKYQSKVILSLIPDRCQSQASFLEHAQLNFPSFPYQYPKGIQQKDFPKEDDHFNNSGHKKYADFLEEIIGG